MGTSCLANYSNYRKCGEILEKRINGVGEEYQHKYVLLCSICQEVCTQFKTFISHIKEQHQDEAQQNNKEHIHYHQKSPESCRSEIYEISGSDGEENKNNETKIADNDITDPLHEPEVMLVQPEAELVSVSLLANSNDCNPNKATRKKKPMSNIGGPPIKLPCNIKDKELVSSYYHKRDSGEGGVKNDANTQCIYVNDNISGAIDENSVIVFYKTGKPKPHTKGLGIEAGVKKFISKRANVLSFISSYQEQRGLWDNSKTVTVQDTKNDSYKSHQESLMKIVQDVNNKLSYRLSLEEAERIIKHLRLRYIKELRFRSQYKDNYNKDTHKPLWFFEQLDFLRPALSFMHEMQEEEILFQTNLNEQQIVTFIGLYKNYPCLWDEDDLYYNSEQKRDEALRGMQQDMSDKLNIKYSLPEIVLKIDILHKAVKKKKEQLILFDFEQPRRNTKEKTGVAKATTLVSNNRFYEHFSYLLPHLGPFKCELCQKLVGHVYTYRIHMAKHNGTKPFKCSICYNEFTQKPGYVIHLRRHTKDFPFVCKFCNKGFPCKKELKLHFQNHPEYVKDYICDVCGNGFTQRKLLNLHLKSHNNTRDFVCDICKKSFTNSKLLFQHRSVHSKEKSFCKLCGKSYAHYRGLSRHMVKDHDTTVAAVAAKFGEKLKRHSINVNARTPTALTGNLLLDG